LGHSHSIINEPSKLLICVETDGVAPIFTVIFTVNPQRSSIGAGFRPVQPKRTFRDLSTSIDSHDDRGQHHPHHRRASVWVRETP